MAAAEQSKIIGSTKSNKTSSSSTSFFGWGSNSTVVVDEVVDGLQATTLSSEPPFSTVEEWTTLFSLGCAYEHPDRLALRFIRARKWDVEKAVDMACAQLKWRREFGVEELLAQGEAKIDLEEIKSGKTYIHGVDKEQRPIVWAHPRLHDKNSVTLELSQNYTILTGKFFFASTSQFIFFKSNPSHLSRNWKVGIEG